MGLADAESVDVICADSPKDVQRLKLIAEELDNDTGRDVYLAFYSGLETVSQVAEQLGLTMQLVSYHVEKLLLAGLIREKKGSVWMSVKGKSVKHYEPSKAALLILPSLQYLKKSKEMVASTRQSLLNALSRILPEVLLPVAAFFAVLYSPELTSAARVIATYIVGLGKTTTLAPNMKPEPPLPTTATNTTVPTASSSIVSSITANVQFVGASASHHTLDTIAIGLLAAFIVWLAVHIVRSKH
ncbi:hypothetical protein B9Q03_07625 [Candidatus Marsarchaeota G2 archaeon OSP_D]|uniref:HTH arsR-type domain-containing protein n=5 Tax=Candidatus Marsarchaeota group 2 TaxID=2203771 RepID=A0A2R6B751_9ARCH|nr:MAG: hypothetical protein B9Q03_07625 [Candidatus Marsarchaeota G2 archaeon OSP_D]PSN94298.1 MAG: hypothetical protein B9Q06_09580 [Candidatus Marsarchaeota G2 archaeon ECH_B_2]PSN97405.1 MAG: hypothetical protein B9Q09_00815 [Candidatus Marsarchaeota G2 archaeon ECH_B_SAG-C16]PSN99503.1 MAG: hypothetical protein B9Q07_06665 [Candidatus Marsarchaeota G2 archaeon ECH_B_3]PSO01822.1 MAG: hypothetical protein B9Q05_07325 [Candidatus Marsarchaeota G2 archaeon ECH_B_1]